jgi:hypothetical protein
MDFVWDHGISIHPYKWAAPNWDGHGIVWLEEKYNRAKRICYLLPEY